MLMPTNVFITSDLGTAAYLMVQGLSLISAQKGPTGKFEFIFDDPDSTAVGQAVGYVNSDCAKFDAQVRNLKNLLYKSKSTV